MQYIGVDGNRHAVNVEDPRNSKGRLCKYMCCPCCLPLDDGQKQQFINCAKSFTVWLFFAQVAYFIASLAVGGFAPPAVNPLFGPCPKGLFVLGAFQPYLCVKEYHLWRFLLPLLLHGGLIHLALNAWAELRFGLYIERRIGIVRTIFIYVLGTIAGCLLSGLIKKPKLSVGASSALCCLMGAHLVEILCQWHDTNAVERRFALIQILIYIALTMSMSFIPFVDAGAHLGGLICGCLLGMIFFANDISRWARAKQIMLRVVGGVLLLIYFLTTILCLYLVVDVGAPLTQEQIDYCG